MHLAAPPLLLASAALEWNHPSHFSSFRLFVVQCAELYAFGGLNPERLLSMMLSLGSCVIWVPCLDVEGLAAGKDM